MKIGNLLFKAQQKMRGYFVRDSCIHKSSKIEAGSVLVSTTVGRHSFCGYDCELINVSVGSFCSIASGVRIGGAHHPIEYLSTSPVFLSHKDSVKAKFADHDYLPRIQTTIGHDVWIGAGVFVKAGVSIGDGAVVGMGSVVTKDVPPYGIVAGNPASLIRKRFSEEIIEGLLRLQWWHFDDIDLKRIGPLVSNPERLLRGESLK
tara:strand:- start:4186 stop:4797 length:612 start_codon:yes stop_codon:yes gene_type:complete